MPLLCTLSLVFEQLVSLIILLSINLQGLLERGLGLPALAACSLPETLWDGP